MRQEYVFRVPCLSAGFFSNRPVTTTRSVRFQSDYYVIVAYNFRPLPSEPDYSRRPPTLSSGNIPFDSEINRNRSQRKRKYLVQDLFIRDIIQNAFLQNDKFNLNHLHVIV